MAVAPATSWQRGPKPVAESGLLVGTQQPSPCLADHGWPWLDPTVFLVSVAPDMRFPVFG